MSFRNLCARGAILLAVATFLLWPVPARAQIIGNGSFENGSFTPNGFGFQSLPLGSTAVTGWTIFNAEAAWIGTPNVANWPASDGNLFIDLTGTHDSAPYAGIRQSLSTVIGSAYHVDFDLSVDQSSTVSNGPITVRVAATGTSFQDFTYNPPGSGIQWGSFGYDFVAAGASTDLSFLGLLAAGGSAMELDNVQVTAVPEPGSLALCGLGVCGWLLRCRNKRAVGLTAAAIALAMLLAVPAGAPAQVITLQNATATFSQTTFGGQPVGQSIDGDFSQSNGWAIATSTGFGGTDAQTAVWETVTNLSAGNLTFTMHFLQSGSSQHLLGRFRFSTTTDNRSLFADGLDSGGDVSANWVVLANPSVLGPAGMNFTTLGDQSVLASGTVPNSGVYNVTYVTPLVGITGFRLEALEDPSLPGGNGPGFGTINGNFTLTELQATAVPEPGSLALCGLAAGGWLLRRRIKRAVGLTRAAIALAAFVALPAVAPAQIVFSDGTFNDGDWTVFSYTGNGTVAAQQIPTGVNPGQYRRVDHQNFSGVLEAYHLRSAAVIDPGISPIISVNWSEDQIAIQNLFGIGVGLRPALKQNGKYYDTRTVVSFTNDPIWASFSRTGLTANDFSTIADANDHPDFSATGGLIQFGFNTANNNGSFTVSRAAGFDNWSITVNPVPEPGSVALCGLAATVLRWRTRRMARLQQWSQS